MTLPTFHVSVHDLKNEPNVWREGARGIVFKGGLIALIHYKTWDHYVLPGGGIENNESPQEAFEREVLEEIGYTVVSVRPVCLVEERYEDSAWRHHFFIADVHQGPFEIQWTDEEKALHPSLIWLSVEEALTLLSEHVGHHPYSENTMQREFLGLMQALSMHLQTP